MSPGNSQGPPFLPLAFRFSASFGLLILHLTFPSDAGRPPAHEGVYLSLLLAFFIESTWEAAHSVAKGNPPFATPGLAWIRINLGLDIALVTLMIAFQGVDQERFAALYIFPVLASAFYLVVQEIVVVGVLSVFTHVVVLLMFTEGWVGPFGPSLAPQTLEPMDQAYILTFSSLQIFAATLVVVLIRQNLEGLTETLRASKAKVEDLSALHLRVVESLFSGLITTDLQGRITSANPAAEQILQRQLHTGQSLRTLLDLDLGEALHRDRRFETLFHPHPEENRILGGHAAPLRDSEGSQTGHLILFQDLTEMKALQERTRISERLAAVGELSAGLAHELRNPMASILGCVHLLRVEDQPQLMRERALGILGRESERVSHILTNFLEFARPQDVRITPLFLPPLVEQLRASWETDSRTEGIPLRWGTIPDLWILADPQFFHQVFTNLLSNARKAVARKGTGEVRVLGEVRGMELLLIVEDTGCGMSPEQLGRLFVPFASDFLEGTGLGMSLVYQFIQQMSWNIQVKSEEGQGTQVHLRIPVAP